MKYLFIIYLFITFIYIVFIVYYLSLLAGIGFGGSQFSLFLTYALLFWYGSTLIMNGEVNFEGMMTTILCLMLGALGLGQVTTYT